MFEQREILAPYPGLRPFEPHEAAIFFGREEHIGRLLEILRRERFIAVIGPSGSGKSSLVRAGMLPALTAGWMGTGGHWRIAVTRPGDRPIRQLARALMALAALGGELLAGSRSSDDVAAVAPIEAELRRGPLGLVQLLEDARRRPSGGPPFDLLVLVDQFEEIFRYSRRGASEANESDAFVDLLLESRRVEGARIHIALAMRSDFLGNCVDFVDLPEAINRAQYLTPRLRREQLAAAIREPARVFGGEVEPELVNDLINAVSRDPDQLLVLQHGLARMWEAASAADGDAPVIRRADLVATGGMDGALARHADAVLYGLGPGRAALAQGLFRAITERASDNSGRDTRRPQRLGEVAKATGRDWREFVPVVEAFSREGANFLTYVPPLNEESPIDISHETLIRQWPRLQAWVAEEFERASDYRRWRDRSLDWQKGAELLVGADLTRAREWLRGASRVTAATPGDAGPTGAEPVVDDWKPTAGWAARYALRETRQPREEFEQTVAFIERSGAREQERKEEAERAEAELRERDRQRLEAEARAAKAEAEAEREQARAARQRVRDLEKVIAEIPDEARRQALTKRFLEGTIKHLSKGQEKRLAATLGSGSATGRARGRTEHGLKLWENGATLRVRFMRGTAEEHRKVKQAAAEWSRYANVHFSFGSAPDAEVRVSFDPNNGSWAYMSLDALAIPKDQPTMNLGWVAENVLHEFGHVLGLIHETNNPNVDLPWNKPIVYRDLQGPPNYWSKEQVDNVLFAKYRDIDYRKFDPESIMAYWYPSSWFLDGRVIPGGKVLSRSDQAFVRKLYPRARAVNRSPRIRSNRRS